MMLKEKKLLNSVTYIICNDEFLYMLNKKHLDHDYYTDILTFDFSESKNHLSGEIYISIDRVSDNAKNYNVLRNNELHRVMIHGILHLCGYNDDTDFAKYTMSRKEDYYLNKLKNVSRETSTCSE